MRIHFLDRRFKSIKALVTRQLKASDELEPRVAIGSLDTLPGLHAESCNHLLGGGAVGSVVVGIADVNVPVVVFRTVDWTTFNVNVADLGGLVSLNVCV
jgi:hypothetical protein